MGESYSDPVRLGRPACYNRDFTAKEGPAAMAEIQRIDTIPALDALIARSNETPVWLFKHSLTCGVSSYAWSELQRFAAESPEDGAVFAVIEIQVARPVSDALAQRTGVRHESPQIFLLRQGQVAWQASHYGINRQALVQA